MFSPAMVNGKNGNGKAFNLQKCTQNSLNAHFDNYNMCRWKTEAGICTNIIQMQRFIDFI